MNVNADEKDWKLFRKEYESFIRVNKSRSYSRSVELANRHFENYFGESFDISVLRLRDCEIFVSDLLVKAPKGFRVYFRNYKAMFNKALDWELIGRNPFVKIKLPKSQKLKPVFLCADELREINMHITSRSVRDICSFAFLTGCRLNEILTLRWENINFADRSVVIGDESFLTKSRKQRVIPMCEEVYNILRRREAHLMAGNENQKIFMLNLKDSPVFWNRWRTMYSRDYVSKSFKNGCRKAGIDGRVHFHSLRHSFASNLVQRGVGLYAVKELLGHSSITTTEIYSHLNMSTLRDAVSVFDKMEILEAAGNDK